MFNKCLRNLANVLLAWKVVSLNLGCHRCATEALNPNAVEETGPEQLIADKMHVALDESVCLMLL